MVKGHLTPSQCKRNALVGVLLLGAISTMTIIAADGPAVQSQLLRAVTVTHDLEASLTFYVDILGQRVIERRQLDADRSRSWLQLGPKASVTFVVLAGSGEYPGGPVVGGRIAFLGIDDPDRGARRVVNRRATDTDMVLPHRVQNLDEIYRRIQDAGHAVLYPPAVSSTGRSRTMMLFDPNGHIVELFELFPPGG